MGAGQGPGNEATQTTFSAIFLMVWSENETTKTLLKNRWAMRGEGSGCKTKTMFVSFIQKIEVSSLPSSADAVPLSPVQ